MRLFDLTQIRTGFQFRERVEYITDGGVIVAQIDELRTHSRPFGPSTRRTAFLGDPAAHLLHRGDVLFLARGHKPFAVAINQDYPDVIAPSHFYVLTPNPALVLPGYLAWQLNQPAVLATFDSTKSASHIPLIPRVVFDQLDIDVPPLAVQQYVADVARLAGREARLLEELRDARRTLINHACLEAVAAAAHNGESK